jgi:hypothetical protein
VTTGNGVSPATSSASGRPEPPAADGWSGLDCSRGRVAGEPGPNVICVKRTYSAQPILVEELVEALYDLMRDDGETVTPPCFSADTE